MRIEYMIDDETKRKLGVKRKGSRKGRSKDKTSKKSKKERLTRRDIEELMDVNRPTYKRGKGGAFRQK